MKVKVLSWNIWGGKYLDEVISQLKEIDADIIGLQEVKEIISGDNRANIAQQIAQELGYQYFYCKAYTDDRHEGGFDFGNAILTKFPIVKSECLVLSGTEYYQKDALTEPRAACVCSVKIGDQRLKIVNIHLGYSRDASLSPLRKIQLDLVLKLVEDKRIVLAGDFNSIPESEVVKKLNEVMINTDPILDQKTKTDVDTPGQPQFRIDYIFVSPDLKFSNFQILETEASDHKPILVEIEI